LELSALRRNAEAREREWQAKVRLTKHVLVLAMSKAVFKNSVVNLLQAHNHVTEVKQFKCVKMMELQFYRPIFLNGFLKNVVDLKIVLRSASF